MKESQNERILRALNNGARLTHRDAQRLFNCDRLGGRVYDLKQRGWPVQSTMILTATGKRVAEYWMAAK